ncbi:unnamed protein product, partial [Didymodactylos carnosus]
MLLQSLVASLQRFCNDFSTLFHRTYLLTIRKWSQLIIELLFPFIFLCFLFLITYIIGRTSLNSYRLERFRPQDLMYTSLNQTTFTNITNGIPANLIYYYPQSTCTEAIVNSTITKLQISWPLFSPT